MKCITALPSQVKGLRVRCCRGLDHLFLQLPDLQGECVNQLKKKGMRGADWRGNIRRRRRGGGGGTAVNETDSIAQT